MLYGIIAVSLVFIITLPILVEVYGYYDGKLKKIFFSIKVYKIIKIFGGYIELIKRLVFIHYKRKKALCFGLADGGVSVPPGIIKQIVFLEFSSALSLPMSENPFKIAIIDNVLINDVFCVLKTNNEHLKVDHNLEIGRDENTRICLKTSVMLSVLAVIIIFIKIQRSKNAKQ